jgi:Protein of unknown function (DUF2510)
VRGHTISIDTQTRVPAGWYIDPGQTGGKRWWDGTKWTSHLKAPEVVATKTAAPKVNPYGIVTTGVAADGTALTTSVIEEPTAVYSNKLGWASLLIGVLAIAATTATFLPGPIVFWTAGVSIVALLIGARALSHRSKKQATILWAPVIGMVFATTATVITLLGFTILTLVSSATGSFLPATHTITKAYSIQTSAEPFVFASNQQLTGDGTTLQQLATSINRAYASGNSTLADGQSWPVLSKDSGSQVASQDGSLLVNLPKGQNFTYRLSTDKKSYTLTVAAGGLTESAIYYSATDLFSFNCQATDQNCVPNR